MTQFWNRKDLPYYGFSADGEHGLTDCLSKLALNGSKEAIRCILGATWVPKWKFWLIFPSVQMVTDEESCLIW